MEGKPVVKSYIDDFNIIEVLDSNLSERHLSTRKTKMKIHARKTEIVFEAIDDLASEILMVINSKKTQMLCINQNSNYKTNTYLYTDNTKIESCERLKILGFTFDKNPTCSAQIGELLEKFRARLWSLRVLAKGGLSQEDLIKFYTTSLRPVLEYTQVTYHSMLSVTQSAELERAQARVLKIIYGLEKSYNGALQESGLERLESRRRSAFEKFAQRAAVNPRINDRWFPQNFETEHDTRERKKYLEEFARTEKLMRSPIFEMRRFLNGQNVR